MIKSMTGYGKSNMSKNLRFKRISSRNKKCKP